MRMSKKRGIVLPKSRALMALMDLERNNGMMIEPETAQEAAMLWRGLRSRGWVEGHDTTEAGRRALQDGGKADG